MSKEKVFVENITKRNADFSQWYTDVALKTEMVDYGPVRGTMVIRPYGYAVWELIQRQMDDMFKATGHSNVCFPMFIPESLLQKEADHVEGFAPEVAWVTHGGGEQLAERLAIRPTSETLFCDMYAKWVQSWRDLPMLYNQWCSVVRWEKTTRPFLRSLEFLWQEGHTIHATAEEAIEETERMLGVYRDFQEKVLAVPVISGRKSEGEKFAGAQATYSIEAMMQDGKALQAGTSHYFGDRFAKAFDIKFLDKDGVQKYVHETSWGASTRMIGGVIMVHGDDRGLVLPPKIAPVQVVIIPIAAHKEGVAEKAGELFETLRRAGLRVRLDDRDTCSAGYKFNDWEMKGVPLRVELGPKDIELGQLTVVRRDTLEKGVIPATGCEKALEDMLAEIQLSMFTSAKRHMDSRIRDAHTLDEVISGVEGGFARAMWCGGEACEQNMKKTHGITTRNIPADQTPVGDTCACCGEKAQTLIYFAKSY